MNILLLSWRGPKHPNAGGAEISTHEHAKGWVKAGHHVTLFTSYYEGAKREDEIDGVHIIRSGRQIFGVHLNAFKWYLFDKHPKFDLIIDQFHGIPFFTPLYARAKKLAFIHEVAKEVWKTNFNLLPAKIGEFLEPHIFKLYKQSLLPWSKNIPFMTVSESTKSDLIYWGIPSTNISVINNGISLPKNFKPKSKEKIKTIIFLGAISKDKGIEDSLVTFSYLLKKDEAFQFWIVGKANPIYLKDLRIKCRQLGIEKNVKFWGFVDEEKKFELLSKAHLLINPSIREGWGLVVIEAASVGTPTVGYNVQGLKDSIRDGITGFLSKDQTPLSLAESILNILSNKESYSKMSGNAKAWSKNFSWEKAGKQSLKLLEKIVV